jgi:hypothetical protein
VRARNGWLPTLGDATQAYVRTGEAIIVDCECASCGDRSAASRCALRRARDFDDRIAVCSQCGRPAVRIEIRDQFSVTELAELFGARPLPVGYVVASHARGAITIDIAAP